MAFFFQALLSKPEIAIEGILEGATILPIIIMVEDMDMIAVGTQIIIIVIVISKILSVGIEVIRGDTVVDVIKIPLAEVLVLEKDIELRINKFQQKQLQKTIDCVRICSLLLRPVTKPIGE